MHMLHYYLQEFPLYVWSLAGLITLCHGVTVHMSCRFYFTMSFFQDQVARLADTFIYFLDVCSLPFCFHMCHFGLFVCEVPYHALLRIAQGWIVRVWYFASSVFFQQAVLWGRHPWLRLYSSWCQALHSYMRYICMRFLVCRLSSRMRIIFRYHIVPSCTGHAADHV